MKSIKGLVWYEQDGNIIKRKVGTDSRIIWEMLMRNYKNIPHVTKIYRDHIGLTNENVHKIISNDTRRTNT